MKIPRRIQIHPSQVLSLFLLICLPGLLYFFILNARIPMVLRGLSISTRYSFTLIVPVVFGLAWLIYKVRGWAGVLLGSLFGFALFALALAGLWASGQSEPLVVSGLLPWNDASAYYVDVLRFLQGDGFSSFSSRRPIFPTIFVSILTLTGQNLQWAVAVLVLLTSSSIVLGLREFKQTHGSLMPAIMLGILFLFYRRFTGAVMTEHIGILFGMVGLALLWRAAGSRQPKMILAGIFFLTLGLLARAGPFFILPFLVLWTGWHLRGDKRFSWQYAAMACLAAGLAFGCNYLLFKLYGSEESQLLYNFSYSLYGLAAGGKSWTQIFTDHPELRGLPTSQMANQIYAIIIEQIFTHPELLVKGILSEFRYFFTHTYYGAYSFVSSDQAWLTRLAQVLLGLAAGVGAVMCLLRRTPRHILVLAAWAGILLSVPFVPPSHTFNVRAYAAAIPWFALLPALGITDLVDQLRLGRDNQTETGATNWQPLVALAGGMLAVALIGPAVISRIIAPIPYEIPECPQGLQPAVMRWQPGSSIEIRPTKEFFLDWLPIFHHDRFAKFSHNLPNSDATAVFEAVTPPVIIFNTLELATGKNTWVIYHGEAIEQLSPGSLAMCGEWKPEQTLSGYDFFQAVPIHQETGK